MAGKHRAWDTQHRLDKLVVIPKGKRPKLTPSDTDSRLQARPLKAPIPKKGKR